MSKPFLAITLAASAAEPTDLQKDLATARQAALRVGAEVAYQVNAFAAICAKHGLANILAAMSPDEAEAWQSLITSTRAYWEANSPHAFPAIPDQPVTPPAE